MGAGINKEIRRAAYNRDGGKCQVCKQDVDFDLFECGHIIDRVMGGKSELDNLVVMCLRCNKVKPRHSNREDFDRWVQSREWEKSKIPVMSEDAISRFWFKVDRSGECWVWKGKLNRDGYGCFYPYGKHQGSFHAHRVSYFLQHGVLPVGMYVLHSCHNRACVNPAHLRLGTPQENALDMIRAGTHRTGTPRKLTWEQVCEIRATHNTHKITYQELANQYGVSLQTISKIIRQESRRNPDHPQRLDRSRPATEQPIERLYHRVDKRIIQNEAGCWIWPNRPAPDAVPVTSLGDNGLSVRKVLWQRYIGEIPDGVRVWNTCGSQVCVNPYHCVLR